MLLQIRQSGLVKFLHVCTVSCKAYASAQLLSACSILLSCIGVVKQLSLLLLGCWSCYPVVWLFDDGARALSSDATVSIYTCLDILSQCIFGLMLVRNVKGMNAEFYMSARNDSKSVQREEEAQSILHGSEGAAV